VDRARSWRGAAVIITALPLYHIFSLTVNCLVMMFVGGENVLITNPRDISGFVKELARHKYSMITGVNTLFNALLNHPTSPGRISRTSSSPRRRHGGAEAVAERWKQVTGTTLIEGYGLTETAPSATANPLNLAEYSGSIGVPMPSTEVELRDDATAACPRPARRDLHPRPPGDEGLLAAARRDRKVLGQDGFLHTGDVGIMDDKGFIRIVDRKKDMILVSGFNVYPNEIEQVVAAHPGVLECAAIGVPDEHSGEVPKVFVVRKDPQLTEQDVLEHCRKELTGYKRPKYVEFRSSCRRRTSARSCAARCARRRRPPKAGERRSSGTCLPPVNGCVSMPMRQCGNRCYNRMQMLYSLYEAQHMALVPLRFLAELTRGWFGHPFSPFAHHPLSRRFAASSDLFLRVTDRYEKPTGTWRKPNRESSLNSRSAS
jgi:acyl-CoA synthetase (AMP-forming)/AMP-acid ligase II